MPLASSSKTGRKNRNFERPRTLKFFLLDYSNQGGWGMSVFLKGALLSIAICQFISKYSIMNVQS